MEIDMYEVAFMAAMAACIANLTGKVKAFRGLIMLALALWIMQMLEILQHFPTPDFQMLNDANFIAGMRIIGVFMLMVTLSHEKRRTDSDMIEAGEY